MSALVGASGGVRRYADLGVDRLIIELEGIDDTAVDGVIASVGETLAGQV